MARHRPAWVAICLVLVIVPGCVEPPAENPIALTPSTALLAPGPYTTIVIEVDHVEGWSPSPEVMRVLSDTLENVTGKPIRIVPPTVIPRMSLTSQQPYRWTLAELRELHGRVFTYGDVGEYGRGAAAVTHVLFLDGRYESALGLEDDGVVYMFEPNGYATGWRAEGPTGDAYVRSVLIHEVGHALGLVNNGVPMVRDHAMPGDPVHSANPKSVMYAGIEDIDILRALADSQDGPPYRFDADDLSDLAAFRAASQPSASPAGSN